MVLLQLPPRAEEGLMQGLGLDRPFELTSAKSVPPASPQVRPMSTDEPPPPRLGFGFHIADLNEAVSARSLPLLQLTLASRPGSCCCTSTHLVHEAVCSRHVPALEFLLQNGAAVDELCRGTRPLHLASSRCMAQGDVGYVMTEMLLRHGANPNVCDGDDKEQLPPLHIAAKRCSVALITLLLSYGADINSVDAWGKTPLHTVCQQASPFGQASFDMGALTKGAELALKHLLRAGADPLRSDASGLLPAAILHGSQPELEKLLLDAGQWWNEYGVKSVRAYYMLDRTHITDCRAACFSQPDVYQHIVRFL